MLRFTIILVSYLEKRKRNVIYLFSYNFSFFSQLNDHIEHCWFLFICIGLRIYFILMCNLKMSKTPSLLLINVYRIYYYSVRSLLCYHRDLFSRILLFFSSLLLLFFFFFKVIVLKFFFHVCDELISWFLAQGLNVFLLFIHGW